MPCKAVRAVRASSLRTNFSVITYSPCEQGMKCKLAHRSWLTALGGAKKGSRQGVSRLARAAPAASMAGKVRCASAGGGPNLSRDQIVMALDTVHVRSWSAAAVDAATALAGRHTRRSGLLLPDRSLPRFRQSCGPIPLPPFHPRTPFGGMPRCI